MYDAHMDNDERTALELPRRELVGVAEIAERTGMGRPAISNAAHRRASSGFPKPVQTLKMGPVYDWSEVKAWHEGRQA